MAWPTMQAKVRMLLDVLDEDIRHVEIVLLRLDALRALLVKRDDMGLEKLLEEIHRQGETYCDNEQRRQALRTELAAQCGCRPSDLTLSTLRGRLSGQSRAAIEQRQARLQTLVEQLKREYQLTTLLVADCARFNRSLMRALFGSDGKGSMTYGPSGAAKHQTGTTLVSLQF